MRTLLILCLSLGGCAPTMHHGPSSRALQLDERLAATVEHSPRADLDRMKLAKELEQQGHVVAALRNYPPRV